ncbi:hypothetical protein M569_05533, partial [Genlisea aurea]
AEDITAVDSESGIRIKTAPGRGAFVEDIFVRGFHMYTMKYAFWMTGAYGSHPDGGWDPKAIPVVRNVNYADVVATNVTMAGNLAGISGSPFTGICIQNVTVEIKAKKKKKPAWNCTDIAGSSNRVAPAACPLLPEKAAECAFPTDVLPIDQVELKVCS